MMNENRFLPVLYEKRFLPVLYENQTLFDRSSFAHHSLIIRSSFAHHSLMMIIRSSFVHRSLIIRSSFARDSSFLHEVNFSVPKTPERKIQFYAPEFTLLKAHFWNAKYTFSLENAIFQYRKLRSVKCDFTLRSLLC